MHNYSQHSHQSDWSNSLQLSEWSAARDEDAQGRQLPQQKHYADYFFSAQPSSLRLGLGLDESLALAFPALASQNNAFLVAASSSNPMNPPLLHDSAHLISPAFTPLLPFNNALSLAASPEPQKDNFIPSASIVQASPPQEPTVLDAFLLHHQQQMCNIPGPHRRNSTSFSQTSRVVAIRSESVCQGLQSVQRSVSEPTTSTSFVHQPAKKRASKTARKPSGPSTSALPRFKATELELEFLFGEFEKNPFPNGVERKRIADSLGMETRQVQFWFQNRRAKARVTKREA
ncbi:hypothetical protein BC830DRAFT_1081991 [Chytriomyces sp. MP71]|nr:hypothetical protein BC830DRAFT_1081991 [Chytriomyces sp. MP71]